MTGRPSLAMKSVASPSRFSRKGSGTRNRVTGRDIQRSLRPIQSTGGVDAPPRSSVQSLSQSRAGSARADPPGQIWIDRRRRGLDHFAFQLRPFHKKARQKRGVVHVSRLSALVRIAGVSCDRSPQRGCECSGSAGCPQRRCSPLYGGLGRRAGWHSASRASALRRLSTGFVGLVVSTGGTGFAPRDQTPEGTRRVIDREAPGLAEACRLVNPLGRLSRGIAGTIGSVVVVNLPGSPKGCVEQLAAILDVLPHALRLLVDAPTPH